MIRNILFFTVVLVSSLGATCMPEAKFVDAMQGVYDNVGPEWKTYYESDTKLSDAEKARRKKLFESWGLTLKEYKEKR